MAKIIGNILTTRFPEIKPALIHSNVIFPCGIAAYLLSLKTGSRLVISEHWSKTEQFLRRFPYRSIALKTYKANKAIICVSGFLAGKIKKNAPHNNIIQIPNIVNPAIFGYKPKKPFDGINITFTCIATWRPPKRLDLILGTLSLLAAESKLNITLNLIGGGIQANAVDPSKLPENLTVIKHGILIDKTAIAALLQSADFFLHASDVETFSIVTAEALTTGTPALVSGTGALGELVRPGNGFITDNTIESWKKSIIKLIAASYNHEAIAAENYGKFSPESVGTSIISIYRKTLNEI
jgi:glycosyltransferase involved in cell wall biosynthesis